MSSSYPLPPPSTNAGADPNPDTTQQGPDAHAYPAHPQFITDAAAAAVAAAHHGLQALQAAVAAPAPVPSPSPSPVMPHHAAIPNASALGNAGPPVGLANTLSPVNPKATRLRRACDMCSQRKIKCDATQPCKPCHELGVDCTFTRTRKRRGPPNKHAEAAKAAKQQRLVPNISPTPHNAAETLISIAGGQETAPALDAESIAPWPVVALLIDDFFTYIHPLTPFPHEPTFRMSFTAREDRTNKGFLALLSSMIGCLVASFPRTARLHLKAQQHGMHMYPKALTLIERCRAIALDARGSAFYTREEVTVHDAATSYFLSLAAAYTMQWKACRRFMAEAMTFVRELGYHKPRDMGSSMFGIAYRGPCVNHVEDQLGRRIFWCMFLSTRSMSQLGGHYSDIILPPPTPNEPYPELPSEVDDQYILSHQILGQPEGSVSLLTGFNQSIRVYMTMNGLVSVELSYGIATLPFHDQKAMLEESLQAVKHVMDGMPGELAIDLNVGSPHGLPDLHFVGPAPGDPDDGHNGMDYLPTAYAAVQPTSDFGDPASHTTASHTTGPHPPERRRVLQYEIQKANIYASQLATRSYYVERYLNLRDAHREHASAQVAAASSFGQPNGDPASTSTSTSSEANQSVAAAALHVAAAAAEHSDPVDAAMAGERELIVQHLLTVLTSIAQRSMEPNGASLIHKIRQVASTLVNDAPERKGPLAVKAQESLSRFVEILMRLERIPPGTGGGFVGTGVGVAGDEEVELRNWADLRETQTRFLQGGGFMGLLAGYLPRAHSPANHRSRAAVSSSAAMTSRCCSCGGRATSNDDDDGDDGDEDDEDDEAAAAQPKSAHAGATRVCSAVRPARLDGWKCAVRPKRAAAVVGAGSGVVVVVVVRERWCRVVAMVGVQRRVLRVGVVVVVGVVVMARVGAADFGGEKRAAVAGRLPHRRVVLDIELRNPRKVEQRPERERVPPAAVRVAVGRVEGQAAQGRAGLVAGLVRREPHGPVLREAGAEPDERRLGRAVDRHAQRVQVVEVAEQREEHGLAELDVRLGAVRLVVDVPSQMVLGGSEQVQADDTAVDVPGHAGYAQHVPVESGARCGTAEIAEHHAAEDGALGRGVELVGLHGEREQSDQLAVVGGRLSILVLELGLEIALDQVIDRRYRGPQGPGSGMESERAQRRGRHRGRMGAVCGLRDGCEQSYEAGRNDAARRAASLMHPSRFLCAAMTWEVMLDAATEPGLVAVN
ncbi:hypothetical protein BT67DRAFT_454823 [Trichocladium antarcticum]|uniref:Zn(2)-C6 fungal-type domain-containing protein n=1 Tax=Trichocladium antarcticum TaxID=1450529 RepID=A0AAN6UNK4_9PEZI|nr:hypothetical protein BT67DRAFT_454823 [Trichocladium antarcticum]